jgi:hypothetical protein
LNRFLRGETLKRSHFLDELTGKVHLSQFEAVSSMNPELARRTLEAQRREAETVMEMKS